MQEFPAKTAQPCSAHTADPPSSLFPPQIWWMCPGREHSLHFSPEKATGQEQSASSCTREAQIGYLGIILHWIFGNNSSPRAVLESPCLELCGDMEQRCPGSAGDAWTQFQSSFQPKQSRGSTEHQSWALSWKNGGIQPLLLDSCPAQPPGSGWTCLHPCPAQASRKSFLCHCRLGIFHISQPEHPWNRITREGWELFKPNSSDPADTSQILLPFYSSLF